MRLTKRVKAIIATATLSLALAMPTLAATVKPDTGMSTSNTKYYTYTTTHKAKNYNDSTLYTYKFRPVWRINTSNSISSTSNASTFSKSAWWSLWKLADSDYEWDKYKKNSKYVEAYYAEGIAVGFGVNVTGSVTAKGGDVAEVSVSASATLGQAFTYKYQGVVSTGKSWSSCNYSCALY